jgi:hypothetical protein
MISTLRRLRQEELEFKASLGHIHSEHEARLGYILKFFLKNKQINK